MKKNQLDNKQPLFNFYPPKKPMIGILSIPHSGEVLPPEFKEYLVSNSKELMQDVDYRVQELIDIDQITNSGIAVIKSNIIRTAIDLNRPKEKCLFNWKKNSKGVQIVTKEPSNEETIRLVELFYSPYFELLKTLSNELKTKTNTPSFIDLHSMPSLATDYHLKINPNQTKLRPDFCLSDQTGKTCTKEFIGTPTQILLKDYPNVTNNDPYFGGHITIHINEQVPEGNNIQIEISRGIYMDESTQQLEKEKVEKLKPILTNAVIETFKKHYTEL
jgi:N-formylglutamate amidohydrolase